MTKIDAFHPFYRDQCSQCKSAVSAQEVSHHAQQLMATHSNGKVCALECMQIKTVEKKRLLH